MDSNKVFFQFYWPIYFSRIFVKITDTFKKKRIQFRKAGHDKLSITS